MAQSDICLWKIAKVTIETTTKSTWTKLYETLQNCLTLECAELKFDFGILKMAGLNHGNGQNVKKIIKYSKLSKNLLLL